MQSNQKYFPVLDREGRLLPCFVAVSNIVSREPQQVRAGNERVIRPRFADAKFFWEQDLKIPLDERREALARIVFQQRLGSILAKSDRMTAVSGWIAQQTDTDITDAERAAQLAKCDLVTLMVGEFGSLQGVMGRYYAAASGESAAVADAIEQHYWPKHSGDRLPVCAPGRAVALADRVDTLLGIFAVGGRPTGVKDPFGLRRAAIAVLRILIETPLPLDLKALLTRAADCFPGDVDAAAGVDDVFDYCIERLKRYYSETGASQPVSGDVIAAVLARNITVPMDIDRRIQAVARFRERSEAAALIAANKRTRNILRKAEDPAQIGVVIDGALLRDDAEVVLVSQLDLVCARVDEMMMVADYDSVLAQLATLGDALDRFFDEVMVMSEESQLKSNRLAILQRLEAIFLNVADLSLLQE
jgi:glycyl-tRNA synthetase beta chain